MDLKILITIILFFVILFLIHKYDEIKKEYSEKCLSLKFWKKKYKKHHEEIFNFLNDLIVFLDKHKIKYWAHAGTLLGVIRHSGFIPWDDDIDLGYIDEIDSNGINKTEILIEDLKANGYYILNNFFGYKIYHNKYPNKFIDLFKFNIKNNIAYQTDMAIILWPKENYYLEELLPLTKGKFEDIEIPIPKNSVSFCIRVYGESYLDVFYLQAPHYNTFFENVIDSIGIYANSEKKLYIKELK